MAKQQKDSILIERFWDTYDFTDTIRLSSSATTEKDAGGLSFSIVGIDRGKGF